MWYTSGPNECVTKRVKKINESEKTGSVPSIIHAVDGVGLQPVCESIRADDSAAAGMLKKT